MRHNTFTMPVALAALMQMAGAPVQADDTVVSLLAQDSSASIRLDLLATYDGRIAGQETDLCDELGGIDNVRINGAAEIVTYDGGSQRLFITHDEVQQVECNDGSEFDVPIFRGVDIVSISDPRTPTLVSRIDTSELGRPTSAAICGGRGFVAVTIAADPDFVPGDDGQLEPVNGEVAFYSKFTGAFLRSVEVGSLPDMITCTPDTRTLLVAVEAEPERNVYVDPEGGVAVIDVSRGLRRLTAQFADFNAFDALADDLRAEGVRIFGNAGGVFGGPETASSVSQDLEPEYIAVSEDSLTAFVTLQENNAVAVLDVASATITDILPMGYKNHEAFAGPSNNGIDASNRDGGINIRPWPVLGMYQPDAIGAYDVDGTTYYVTANEGDSRDYDAFGEETRIGDVEEDLAAGGIFLCEGAFDEALFEDENLGRLKTTIAVPQIAFSELGCVDQLVAYGARSFSIYAEDGTQVYDSGNAFEQITALAVPEGFNSPDDETDFDGRSDDKGPEPEGVAVGRIDGNPYAFILLERTGGVMVYDIADPSAPKFVQYINNRDFANNLGDAAPEGVVFIPEIEAPAFIPMIAVAHESSGTTSLFAITRVNAAP